MSRQRQLADIWHHSAGFNRFRGEDWLPDLCRSCDRRTKDFGGCRCQAFHVTGNAGATDPACSLSPDHGHIESARSQASHAAGVAGPVRISDRSRVSFNDEPTYGYQPDDFARAGRVCLGVFAFVRTALCRWRGCMQAADCSGASGLNCCWASLLRGLLMCSFHPLRSPRGWELSPLCGESCRVDGRSGDSRRTVSIVSLGSRVVHNRSGSRCLDRVDYRQDLAQPDSNADL